MSKKSGKRMTPAERFMRKLDSIRQSKAAKHANEIARQEAEIERKNNLPIGHPDNRHKLDKTFSPVEKWLDTIVATGDIDVMNNGVAVFQTEADTNHWWPVVEAFLAVCDTFELVASDLNVPDQTDGMRKLAKKVEVDMPLFQADIDAARASVSWMRSISETLTPSQFSEYIVAIQIRAEMVEQAKARFTFERDIARAA